MRVAALDLGTNTFILLIAEVEGGRVTRVLHDEVRVIRLGQGVHQSRRFHPEALERARSCFADYSAIIQKYKVDRVQACATSAARDVTNGAELVRLAAQYEIPVEIISGEREAEFTFWGTVRPPLQEPVLIVDVGGGSTEFIHGDDSGILGRISVDIGAVRLTEALVTEHPVPAYEMAKLTSYIQPKLTEAMRALGPVSISRLTAVAGTPTTLAMIEQGVKEFSAEAIDGSVLSMERLRFWVRRLAEMKVEDRQRIPGMEPKRADVIVAGSLILLLSMQTFGARELVVSVRGLRYGLARHLAGGV